jgi:hypothetical protein
MVAELTRCRNASGSWNEITPSELACMPSMFSVLDVAGGADWRPIVSHGQTVSFWLMLMHGDVRWRLPTNQHDPRFHHPPTQVSCRRHMHAPPTI